MIYVIALFDQRFVFISVCWRQNE